MILKVIHLGNMGVGTTLTTGLRQLKHESIVVVEKPHQFGFNEDVVIFPQNDQRHFRTIKIIKTMISVCANADIMHMHGLQNSIYLKAMRLSRSKKVFHYHSTTDEPGPPEGQFHAKFVSLPTRIKKIKNSVWIPLPVDTERMKVLQAPKQTNSEPITIGVGSAFADRSKAKLLCIDLIANAVDDLCNKGYKIKILEFKGYHYQSVLEYWKKVHIWIDRFHTGFYGWSAVNAASCNIPVMCQIDEEMKQYIQDCPFLLTNPTVESIRSNIEYLMNTNSREDIGKMCREYVLQKHDVLKVAQQCVEEYSKITNR
jgi:hypothetical protein